MDDVDITQIRMEKEEQERNAQLEYSIPEGVPGECELCGEWFGRLVNGACVSCRTKYRLE